jgi:hypothetical protein
MLSGVVVVSVARGFAGLKAAAEATLESAAMEPRSIAGEPANTPVSASITADLPVGATELGELGRWVPAKEMALLIEICDRAGSDPDLMRPALLLCSAYARRVARMLDQDPLPTLTRKLNDRLEQLREKHGL